MESFRVAVVFLQHLSGRGVFVSISRRVLRITKAKTTRNIKINADGRFLIPRYIV